MGMMFLVQSVVLWPHHQGLQSAQLRPQSYNSISHSSTQPTLFITLFRCLVVFHFMFIIRHVPPLTYLHGKKLKKIGRNWRRCEWWIVLVWIVLVVSVTVLLWMLLRVNNTWMNIDSHEYCREYNSTQISKCQLECINTKWIFLLCSSSTQYNYNYNYQIQWIWLYVRVFWNRPTWLKNVMLRPSLPILLSKF